MRFHFRVQPQEATEAIVDHVFERQVLLGYVAYIPSLSSFECPDRHREDTLHVQKLEFSPVISAGGGTLSTVGAEGMPPSRVPDSRRSDQNSLEEPGVVVDTFRATHPLDDRGCDRAPDAPSDGFLLGWRRRRLRMAARASLYFVLCGSVRGIERIHIHIRF